MWTVDTKWGTRFDAFDIRRHLPVSRWHNLIVQWALPLPLPREIYGVCKYRTVCGLRLRRLPAASWWRYLAAFAVLMRHVYHRPPPCPATATATAAAAAAATAAAASLTLTAAASLKSGVVLAAAVALALGVACYLPVGG
jgi:hypothetical protein